MTDTSAVARFCASCGNELMPRSTTIQIDGLTYHPRCAESLSQNEADSLRAELDRLRATNAALEKALVDSVAARAKRLKANGAGNVDEYVAYILGQDPAEVTPYVLADAKAHHAASAALTPTPAPQERQPCA